MMSPAEFADKLLAAAREAQSGLVVPTEEAMTMVAEKARSSLGTGGYGWAPHSEATIDRWGEHPLGILSGETQGSVGSMAAAAGEGAEGLVYATTQQAVFFEMGTIHQPPRSFLYQSMVHSLDQIGTIFAGFAEKLLGGLGR